MDRGPADPAEDRPGGGAAFTSVTPRRRRGPAAVALAVVAFLGFAILSKEATPAVGLPVASATPAATLAIVATPSVAPSLPVTSVAPELAPPSRDPSATPHPIAFDLPVPDGITQLIPAGPTPVRLIVSLPKGWRERPGMFFKPSATGPVGLSIGAWRIQHVNTFPCRWATPIYSDVLYPRTAQGLADALSAWWGQDPNSAFYSNSPISPIASAPRQDAIAGRPAWYVEVLIPSDFDLNQCDGGQLVLWETADGTVRSARGPTEHNRLWVIGVDGELIVVDASSPLTPTPAEAAELQAIVDSVGIAP